MISNFSKEEDLRKKVALKVISEAK